MAYISENASHSQSRGLLSRIGDNFVRAFNVASEAKGRIARVEALQSLSDEQLAAKGLRREDIARHVFRDLFYV